MKRVWALLSAVFLYLSEVKIYVKMHHNSPFLACMDKELSQTEIIDPISFWMGPNGKPLKENSHINLTSEGKLMITSFQASLSGSYICTLSYKIISEETQKEQEIYNIYTFMVFGYQEPDFAYQMTVRFTTDSCNGKKNSQFFKLLIRILDEIIIDLTCYIEEPSYKCHFLEIPKHGLKEELFIAFQVRPFSPERKAACSKLSVDCEEITNSNVHQARNRIEEFFLKQTNILKHEFNYIPNIHYVEHSFKVIRIDSCQPGFGKNDILHSDCASCCVVCDPRTYSPNTDVTCQACLTVHIYGAKTCHKPKPKTGKLKTRGENIITWFVEGKRRFGEGARSSVHIRFHHSYYTLESSEETNSECSKGWQICIFQGLDNLNIIRL